MRKKYEIELNGVKIGTTDFEYADAPMGVVHGKINFENVKSPYELIRNHCKEFKIQVNRDEPKQKFIDTVVISELKVYKENGTELNGWGGAITGIDNEGYEIQFGGVDYMIMQTEFAHHYYEYYKNECDLIKIKIDREFREICDKIISRNLNENEWAEIESSGEFQTKSYCGGFDATEREFCFSFYDKNQEYWFQLSLNEIKRIKDGDKEYLYPRKSE